MGCGPDPEILFVDFLNAVIYEMAERHIGSAIVTDGGGTMIWCSDSLPTEAYYTATYAAGKLYVPLWDGQTLVLNADTGGVAASFPCFLSVPCSM